MRVAAWGTLMAKNGLRAAGYGSVDGPAFSPDVVALFLKSDTWIDGAFALEQGFLLTSMILAAITVCLIERQFFQAAAWAAVAAVFSAIGFMHSYAYTATDTVLSLSPAWKWAGGYACMATIFVLARFATETKTEA